MFGALMGDYDDDLFGNHMNVMNMQMRSMNRLMNSFMPDPFNMLASPFDTGFQQNAMVERNNAGPLGLFGFPAMPNMNRLLSADLSAPNGGASYCSSSMITMSSGPDGRPQIYQATSSTKTGPNGVRETRKTVQDSVKGIKKMAIGHHIGERAHIIEKEQDLGSGQLEERQEFINLDEEEAQDFDREFKNKARMVTGGMVRGGARPLEAITIEEIGDDDDEEVEQARSRHNRHHRRQLPALPAPEIQNQPQQQQQPQSQNSSTTDSTTTSSSSSATHANANATDDDDSKKPPAALAKNITKTTNDHQENASSLINNNNNNNYLSAPLSRRAIRNHYYQLHHGGVNARRPLRTPISSPLTTTPTTHHHNITTTSPSVHPHPYNASAARRNHRSKHSQQHQSSKATATKPKRDDVEEL